jgi:hypothetical protein
MKGKVEELPMKSMNNPFDNVRATWKKIRKEKRDAPTWPTGKRFAPPRLRGDPLA